MWYMLYPKRGLSNYLMHGEGFEPSTSIEENVLSVSP
jgi:hypothetical protein